LLYRRISNILSGMTTFTVRDLDRQPAKVLEACDKGGMVRIRTRSGRSYRLLSEDRPGRMRLPPDFAQRHSERLAKLFPKRISAEQTRRADELLAGE
jgi:hypothetical protein